MIQGYATTNSGARNAALQGTPPARNPYDASIAMDLTVQIRLTDQHGQQSKKVK